MVQAIPPAQVARLKESGRWTGLQVSLNQVVSLRGDETANAIYADTLRALGVGLAKGVKEGARDIATGAVNVVVHPVQTAQAVGSLILHPIDSVTALSAEARRETQAYQDAIRRGDTHEAGRIAGKTVVTILSVVAPEVRVTDTGRAGTLADVSRIADTAKPSSVWALLPAERGAALEPTALGRAPNLSGRVSNFPGVDDFIGGVATSIKSYDLRLPSYADASALKSRIWNDAEALSRFRGAFRNAPTGERIGMTNEQIQQRVLLVVIPKGVVLTEHLNAIASVTANIATSLPNVSIIVRELP